ncbi:MAG: hypothetical protein ACRD2W_02135, partial [Acidimicrobiales bacterium]
GAHEDAFFVESQSVPGAYRLVERHGPGNWSCSCPHPTPLCSHLHATAYYLGAVLGAVPKPERRLRSVAE